MSAPIKGKRTAYLPFTRPTLDEETIAGVADVLRSGWITSGPKVKEFETRLSEHCGGRPVRAFNSGTCTMEIALRIAGIGSNAGGNANDEVITTPLSWVSTSNVILEVGAKPVFVDIDPVTRNIDLDRVEAAITPNTRALMPVDLAGLPVDRGRLYDIAGRHGLRVIEDAAQSFGSSWNGHAIGGTYDGAPASSEHGSRLRDANVRESGAAPHSQAASASGVGSPRGAPPPPSGSAGDFVSFSFHANKNVTTIEGGCLVMNDEAEARLAEQYRLQGVVRSGFDGMEVELVGGKFNLTDVAARVGLGQLPQVGAFTVKRRELAWHYFAFLDRDFYSSIGCGLPVADFTQSNWHMFQIVLPEERLAVARAEVMAQLHERGIGSGVHYPAIHLFALYRRLGWKDGDFPNAEYAGRNILTLPLFPAMTRADVERVCEELTDVVKANLK